MNFFEHYVNRRAHWRRSIAVNTYQAVSTMDDSRQLISPVFSAEQIAEHDPAILPILETLTAPLVVEAVGEILLGTTVRHWLAPAQAYPCSDVPTCFVEDLGAVYPSRSTTHTPIDTRYYHTRKLFNDWEVVSEAYWGELPIANAWLESLYPGIGERILALRALRFTPEQIAAQVFQQQELPDGLPLPPLVEDGSA